MLRTRHPGIYRRGSRFVVVWTHRGRQHKSFHRTLAEAREAKARRGSGDTRPASRQRFEEYATRWLDTYGGRTSRGLKERTRRLYRRDMERWVIPHFRGFRLDDIEPPDVRELVLTLENKNLRPSSIRAILAPLKAMLATAVEDGVLRSNPTRGIRVGSRDRSGPSREIRALTRSELSRLLGALPPEHRLLFEFMAHTGLRISEVVGLTWAHIEFGERPKVLVRQQDCRGEVGPLKTGCSHRDVPLSPAMARRLWIEGATEPHDARVFQSVMKRPLNDGNLRRRVLAPAARRAGLEWVTFHSLRHTCASLLFEAGRDVKQVAEWLGHADASFTLRTYISLMDDGMGDAEFLDEAVLVGKGGATGGPEPAATPVPAEAAG
jgi:integrase